MAELLVNKKGFDGYISDLEALSSKISSYSASMPSSSDTSMTLKQAGEIFEILMQCKASMLKLVDVTKADLAKTKAAHISADN